MGSNLASRDPRLAPLDQFFSLPLVHACMHASKQVDLSNPDLIFHLFSFVHTRPSIDQPASSSTILYSTVQYSSAHRTNGYMPINYIRRLHNKQNQRLVGTSGCETTMSLCSKRLREQTSNCTLRIPAKTPTRRPIEEQAQTLGLAVY